MTTATPDEHSGLPESYDPDAPVFTPHADPATENKADMARFSEAGTTDPAQLPVEGEAREELLALVPDNLDAEGHAHFLLMSDRHAPRCGYCRESWPCTTSQGLEAEQRKITGQAPDRTADLVNLDDVAAALGMTRDGLDAQMAARVERDMAREDLTPVGFDGKPAGMSNEEWAHNGFPDTGR